VNGLKDRTFYTEHPILELTERFYGNAVPGPQQGSCGGESGGNAHDKLRVGALERARKTRKPQTGIRPPPVALARQAPAAPVRCLASSEILRREYSFLVIVMDSGYMHMLYL